MHTIFVFSLVILIKTVCVAGFQNPDLHWKFDKATSKGFTREENVSSLTINLGYLFNGTKISSIEKWYAANFSGNYSGVLISNVTNSCILNPESCRSGFSISFHIKWPRYINETGVGHVISSANFSIYSTFDGKLITSLWNGSHEWHVVYKRNTTKYGWTCFVASWDRFTLQLLSNRSLAAFVSSNMTKFHLSKFGSKRTNYSMAHEALPRQILIGTSTKSAVNCLKMFFDDLKIWNIAIRRNESKKACIRATIASEHREERYEYPTQIYTSIRFANKALSGFVMERRVNVTSLSECIESCKKNKLCKSFNIGQVHSHLVCELNSQREKAHGIHLIDREDYYYYDVYWGNENV